MRQVFGRIHVADDGENVAERSRRDFAKAILGLVPLVVWGFASGYVYGFVLNIWSIVGFYHPQSIGQALIVYAAALPFDTMHGIATAVFLVALYGPWMRKLARIRKKYALLGG